MQYINTVLNYFPPLEDLNHNGIRQGRISKEKQLCQSQNAIQWTESELGRTIVTFEFEVLGKYKSQGQILLGRQYPFYQPLIKFEINNQLFSGMNLENFQRHDYFFPKRLWTPKLTVNEIVQNCVLYAQANLQVREQVQVDFLTELVYTLRSNISHQMTAMFVLLLTIMVRILMGFGSYSGQNDSPRYGDFEAQRHWMELTTNSPPRDWYRETPANDLTWWRLDYPPLSGYLAWFLGMISHMYDPKSVELAYSQGYEDPHHKNFMRWTVLIADMIFLYPILILCVKRSYRKFNFDYQYSAILLTLMCPFLIIIDHGHFQYNCIAIGCLSLIGVYLCDQDQLVLGSVMFTCALNFKQMSLYYALGFFAFIIGKIAISSELRSDNRLQVSEIYDIQLNFGRLSFFVGHILLIGLVVFTTTIIIWSPWLSSIESFKEVLGAIFPVHRGLYQLKVATFWCISHIIIKWETLFSNSSLVILSTLLTLVLSLPAMICLVINPKYKPFTVGLFVISQLFFLFGFHVHEKTILLPLVFLLINIRSFGYVMNDYVVIAGITMYPLMKEDGLSIQFLLLWSIYQIFTTKYLDQNKGILIKQEKLDLQTSQPEQYLTKLMMLMAVLHRKIIMKVLYYTNRKMIIGTFISLIVLEQTVTAPDRFPYLFTLLYAVIGFYGFLYTLIYAYSYLLRNTLQSLNKKKQD